MGEDRRKMARLMTLEGEDQDLISELPDEILVPILSHLTLREAVRTSVFSKRWRYLWTCVSVLNFDAKANNLSSSYRTKYGDSQPDIGWSQFIERVSSVLAQHRGPNLDEFRVFCYNLHNAYSSRIEEWIRFALSNRVHTIELNLSNFKSLRFNHSCNAPQHGVMRLSALGYGSCLKNSYNMFVGFKSLKTLLLKAVDVDEEVIEYFLSNCPVLERLSLHLNFALRNLKVVKPSLLLRYLEVVSCELIETIEICDTNLASFTYVGKKTKTMLLKNAPKLVEVSINPNESMWHARAMFLQLSCCFSQLENLQLTVCQLKLEILGNYIFPELKNLKQFVLIVERLFNGSLLGSLVMIKNWPNLQRFVLQLNCNGIHWHDRLKEAPRANMREAARYCHPCLKVVKIVGYCNTCDFELFKHIIEIAVLLEKIIIDTRNPNSNPVGYRELRSGGEQQLRTLVSPRVEFVIL